MDTSKFTTSYRKFLRKNSNVERAEKEKAYLYSDLVHYGVSVWDRRKFTKINKKEILELNKTQALKLVKLLWKKPTHEERSMALLILYLHKDKLGKQDMPLIEKLMRESKGWAFLDNLIIPIMPGILKKDITTYKYLTKWIKDDDYWVRRSALLAQLLFFRKGSGGDKKLFFKLAESQFDETWINKVYSDTQSRKRARFFIRKAIGWTLREMLQSDPDSVVGFVKKNKDRMSGLTFREATRKMTKEQASGVWGQERG